MKKLTFKHVNFQYGFRDTVLTDINLEINKGEKVAIVGESGSGKSTIGKLINRYYDILEGRLQ